MRRFLPLLLVLFVAGCETDPWQKPGTWSLPPAGLDSNDENLRTMLVNPNDLVAGSGTDFSNASQSAQPVQRLITGHRYPLPISEGSAIPAATQPATPATGGAGGAGP
jgi:hypothetical protein